MFGCSVFHTYIISLCVCISSSSYIYDAYKMLKKTKQKKNSVFFHLNFLFVVTYGKFYFRFLLLILPATAVAVVFFFLHSPDDDNDDDVNDVLIFFPLFQESISIFFLQFLIWIIGIFFKKRKKKKRKWLLGYWP